MSFPQVPLSQALSLGRLDAHDQAALLARGELSPAELTAAAIASALTAVASSRQTGTSPPT
mgnify:CR=1 FL=1